MNTTPPNTHRKVIEFLSNSFDYLLARYFIRAVIILLVATAAIVVVKLYSMSHSLVQETALRDAKSYTEALTQFRTLYTSEVVARAQTKGIPVAHDYQQKDGAIPLPATLSKLLGDRLGLGESRCETRLFSGYPFPWAKKGGPQDEFERLALHQLKREPTKPYSRFEKVNGETFLRYATADMMRESCVHCHNTHPDSPKTDWKAGDVRGVLAIRVPITDNMANANSKANGMLVLLLTTGCLMLLMFGFTLYRLNLQSQSERLASSELAQNTDELKKAKKQLEKAHLNLRAKADDLDRSRRAALNLMQDMRAAKDIAEAATKTKTEFLANMSHEIRTPMTAILGFSEIVLGRVTDPQDIESLTTIQRNGEYLLGIINDILDISKIEMGKLSVEHITCSTREVFADVAKLMGVRATAKGLPLTIEYDGPIPAEINSDPTRFRQILINLIGNAIKFTEVGSVRVVVKLLGASSRNPKLRINVIDTGIGLTQEQIKSLFQPFVQADTSTTRKFGGTGLGLTISKRLSQILGGDITVTSAEGKGSTFSLIVETGPLDDVPMVQAPKHSQAQDNRAVVPANSSSQQLNCRVLLAEDGPDNQRLVTFILKKAGAEVEVAENGQIALDRALQAAKDGQPFDVILMDMQMPVLDGYGATAELRNQGYKRPIIALTAHAMSSDREKCLAAGCDDYSTKPVDRPRLIELVAEYSDKFKSIELSDSAN